VDRRQLELFFRSEQGVNTALGHPRDVGQPAFGQTIEPFDRRQLGCVLGDARLGSSARRPGSPVM
jgi:hypothetical protein